MCNAHQFDHTCDDCMLPDNHYDHPKINDIEDKDPLTLQAKAAFLPSVTRRGGSGGVTGWNGTTTVQKPF